MSLKDKLAALLFGAPPEQSPDEQLPAEAINETESLPETTVGVPVNPALLELSPEHAIHQLYRLRRNEAGYLPAPRICLDEDGALSEETVRREKVRLRAGLTGVSAARLKQARGKAGQKTEQKEKDEPLSLDALPCFFFSADKLYAWLLVLPPVGKGMEVSRGLLLRVMAEQGISYGVDTRLIDRLSHMEEKYFHLFLIARGKPAFDGSNGNIVDHFPRVVARMFEVDEYDRVDYTALNLIHNVKEGEEICRLIKPTEGEPGRTVLDEEIPAKNGKSVPLPKGRNTVISEDGETLLAAIAGDVEFTGRSFQVKPVLDIQGNVDFSTGSINFLGDVNIQGDVLSGFTVRAMGSIRVCGVVEAGSTIEAGGDLIVVKGILGDGSTIVRSQRSVFAKYIENAVIYTKENLQADCIINCRVYSDGEVQVRSGRGVIIGGRIWAEKKVSASTVGARSECRTTVVLGGMPCTSFELEVVRRELEKLTEDLARLECQPESTSRTSLMDKTRMKMAMAELKLRQLESELEEIREQTEPETEPEKKTSGRLECGIAYPGTEIVFGEAVLRLRRESRQCVATLVRGEIVLM